MTISHHTLVKLVFVVLILNKLVPPSLAARGTKLGCGLSDTGEPHAIAEITFSDENYPNGTLLSLVIDWGDDHGFRQTYNLSAELRLAFEHTYDNVTDPDNWSYPLLLYADIVLPNETEPRMTRVEINCGMSADTSAAPFFWKCSGVTAFIGVVSLLVTSGIFWSAS